MTKNFLTIIKKRSAHCIMLLLDPNTETSQNLQLLALIQMNRSATIISSKERVPLELSF